MLDSGMERAKILTCGRANEKAQDLAAAYRVLGVVHRREGSCGLAPADTSLDRLSLQHNREGVGSSRIGDTDLECESCL
jgi:hypothetical protein